jgi:ubiquinol-cytochrome c reductase iron-sulfur subunit
MTSPDDANESPDRRSFLSTMVLALGAVGLGGVGWALFKSMDTTPDVSPRPTVVRVSLSTIPRGRQTMVQWIGRPILVAHRSVADIAALSTAASGNAQHALRSQRPEIFVASALCPVDRCVVERDEQPFPPHSQDLVCPCCGSRYDLAGRCYNGPQPVRDLDIPPYHFEDPDTLVIGVAPLGEAVT